MEKIDIQQKKKDKVEVGNRYPAAVVGWAETLWYDALKTNEGKREVTLQFPADKTETLINWKAWKEILNQQDTWRKQQGRLKELENKDSITDGTRGTKGGTRPDGTKKTRKAEPKTQNSAKTTEDRRAGSLVGIRAKGGRRKKDAKQNKEARRETTSPATKVRRTSTTRTQDTPTQTGRRTVTGSNTEKKNRESNPDEQKARQGLERCPKCGTRPNPDEKKDSKRG